MKTKTFVSISLSFVMASVILMAASCDNGDIEPGYFMYDGTTYPMHQGYVMEGGPTNGSYAFQFVAVSSGIDYETLTGTGNAMEIELYSPTATLAEGTYTIVLKPNPGWTNPYNADILRIMINVTASGSNLSGGTQRSAESGTITVSHITAGTIDLSFDVVLEDGKVSTGMYSGPYTLM